jgi:hypothetical protein
MNINAESLKTFTAKLKEAFAAFKPEEVTTEETFGMATLPDGSILKWDGEPAVGTPVMVETAEGDVPATDGEYTLEDMTTIVIVGGVIAEIKKVESEVEVETPEAVAPVAPAAPAEMPMAKEVIERVEKVQKFAEDELAAIKSNITAMSEQVSLMVAQNEEIKKFKEQFSAFQSSVTKAIDELGDAPQNSEPVRNEFRNEENQQSVEERIAATRAKLFNR